MTWLLVSATNKLPIASVTTPRGCLKKAGVGAGVGTFVGDDDGFVGIDVGKADGTNDGTSDGVVDGADEGFSGLFLFMTGATSL